MHRGGAATVFSNFEGGGEPSTENSEALKVRFAPLHSIAGGSLIGGPEMTKQSKATSPAAAFGAAGSDPQPARVAAHEKRN